MNEHVRPDEADQYEEDDDMPDSSPIVPEGHTWLWTLMSLAGLLAAVWFAVWLAYPRLPSTLTRAFQPVELQVVCSQTPDGPRVQAAVMAESSIKIFTQTAYECGYLWIVQR